MRRPLVLALTALCAFPALAQARVPLRPTYANLLVQRKVNLLYPNLTTGRSRGRCHTLTAYIQDCTYIALPNTGASGFEIGAYGSTIGCYRGTATVRKYYPSSTPAYSVRLSRPVAIEVFSISQLSNLCIIPATV